MDLKANPEIIEMGAKPQKQGLFWCIIPNLNPSLTSGYIFGKTK